MIGRHSNDDAQSFEEAWGGGVPRDEHIAALVDFAETLCEEAAQVGPSTVFRESLRARLMTEASTVLVAIPADVGPPAGARRRYRRLASVTAVLVTSAGAAGVVASSASAVPGDMLYPVKRTVESVELQLHREDASRGAFQLARASERLEEARQLSADGGPAELIVETLDDFASEATDGSSKLFSAYGTTGDKQPIQQVNDFVAASSNNLTALSTGLPEEVAAALTAASEAVAALANEASTLCTSCTPANVQALLTPVAERTPAAEAAPKSNDSTVPPPTTSAPSKPTASTPPAARPTATPAPTAATTPAPAVTTKAPSLNDVTDPLIGGLLGDDQQEGLVPGLLNGLLGGTQSP